MKQFRGAAAAHSQKACNNVRAPCQALFAGGCVELACCGWTCCCFLQGYNAAIIAYGQTGTGKTYTMEGSLKGLSEASSRAGGQQYVSVGLYAVVLRAVWCIPLGAADGMLARTGIRSMICSVAAGLSVRNI